MVNFGQQHILTSDYIEKLVTCSYKGGHAGRINLLHGSFLFRQYEKVRR